jgi:hypothetical protein
MFFFGAYNFHNDAFTYIVHSDWLQNHAFSFNIGKDNVTPSSTQVRLYQLYGFRMGGSFLFAFMQSLSHVSLAHEVYAAVVITSLCGGMLAIGYPISKLLSSIRWRDRYLILALPGLLLGGLVFGGNFGFLPQTIGLAVGGGFIFAVGFVGSYVVEQNKQSITNTLLAIALSIFLAAATFAYSELAPFLILSSFISVMAIGVFRYKKVQALLFLVLIYLISAIILNDELIRAYGALRSQSGALVGTPVEWTLIGFISHTLGFHGGAWDGYQWSLPGYLHRSGFYINIAILISIAGFFFYQRKNIFNQISIAAIFPAFTLSLIFFVGIIFFRYFTPDAFERGTGQSWSQFKLSDWANPFVSLFLIVLLLALKNYFIKIRNINISIKFYIIPLLIFALISSYERIKPLSTYYGSKSNLNGFYSEIVSEVNKKCNKDKPIYLNLQGENHKFRQMLSYLLKDYDLKSDWSDDGYIFSVLNNMNNKSLEIDDCIIERVGSGGILESGTTIGLFRAGIFNGSGKMRLMAVTGTYNQESAAGDYWYWVKNQAHFIFSPFYFDDKKRKININFEYGGTSKQNIEVRVIFENNKIITYPIKVLNGDLKKWSVDIEKPPGNVVSLEITTDAPPVKLGVNDDREAAFIIKNISMGYF